MLISSRQNEKIKRIKSLSQKSIRAVLGQYIAEGSKTVREAISHNMPIITLVVTEKWEQEFSRIASRDTEIITVTDSVYQSITDEVNPEGVLAVIKMPNTSVTEPISNKCLLLDGISDPGNMGTIIRTAAAAGYKDLYLKNCVDPFNLKVVRSSMSGIYFVRLHIGTFEEITVNLKDMPVISADMDGVDIFGFEKPKKLCLAVGSEAKGLSDEVIAISTHTVKIPMEKEMESLNAGVSASILMYLLK